jgi:hypothetical protein
MSGRAAQAQAAGVKAAQVLTHGRSALATAFGHTYLAGMVLIACCLIPAPLMPRRKIARDAGQEQPAAGEGPIEPKEEWRLPGEADSDPAMLARLGNPSVSGESSLVTDERRLPLIR